MPDILRALIVILYVVYLFRRRLLTWLLLHTITYRPTWTTKIKPRLQAFTIAAMSIFTKVKITRRGKVKSTAIKIFLKPFFDVRQNMKGEHYIVLRGHNRSFKESC